MPDGQVLHVQGELLILAVGNGRQAGGGMRLCPYAGKCTQPTSPSDALSARAVFKLLQHCMVVLRHASLRLSTCCIGFH